MYFVQRNRHRIDSTRLVGNREIDKLKNTEIEGK